MVRVLLRFVHGLGDAVQFSVVLKHLAKYRPEWRIDVRAGRGKHTALEGLCHHITHDQEPEPKGPYDTEAMLGWYENYAGYADRPNSKITNCLAEVFGLGYDPSLGRYEIRLSADARQRAVDYLRSTGARELGPEKFASVIIHYEGNTSTWKKNLRHWQARAIIDLVVRAGRTPIVLDWDGRSPLPDGKTIFCPAVGKGDIWGGFGSGDAGVIAALVHCSEAFVGIDSGPGKCASATETPTLVCWREHHPIQFHDPAPNTVHLIPGAWRKIPPCEKPGVGEFFEKHYLFRTYTNEHGLVEAARSWLMEVLHVTGSMPAASTPFVVPNGIGDVLWVLHKIKSIAGGKPIDLILSGDPRDSKNHRAVPFLKRFGFIRDVTVLDVPVLESERDEERNDDKGRYRYIRDGVQGGFHYLVPNKVLERGDRLESWLPDHPVDWRVVDEFSWENTDRGTDIGRTLSPFVAVYLGPESGNVDEGHNRGFLWEPKHWCALTRMIADRGFRIAVIGADYDRSYYERYVREGVGQAGMMWTDLIGKLEIGETLALLKQAKCFISYQCGLGIFAHYAGVPVAMWWRPDGDSAHPKRLVSFDERMKDAWTNPAIFAEGKYLGLVYKRETPGDIMQEIEKRGWLT